MAFRLRTLSVLPASKGWAIEIASLLDRISLFIAIGYTSTLVPVDCLYICNACTMRHEKSNEFYDSPKLTVTRDLSHESWKRFLGTIRISLQDSRGRQAT